MELKKVIATLHSLERKVIPVLDKLTTVNQIAQATGLQEVEVVRALQWLQNKKAVIVETRPKELVSLGKNGTKYLKEGLPERRFLEAVRDKELDVNRLEKALPKEEVNVCLGMLRSKAMILLSKDKKLKVKLTDRGKSFLKKDLPEELFLRKAFPLDTKELGAEDKKLLQSLRKRKDLVKVDVEKLKTVKLLEIGKQLIEAGVGDGKVIDRVTPELIRSGDWKKKEFRRYDVEINVPHITGGKRHLVEQASQYIKRIWLDMGFQEMTGSFVQTAFWDLDALFVPQDHPAREMQDTFYIKKPNQGTLPKEYVRAIKNVHENGGTTGSTGWQMPWSEEKAKELLLRTHTTVLSARTLAQLKPENLPAKFFSVSRVFRNETLDWKHLFEFYQVDGIVIDPNANLQHLFGYLKEFYKKMGYADVRLSPSHFPYTEPSVEVHVLHPERNEWVELGGAGIFRPEVVKPLLGIDVPVLAWGLGMERIITAYYGITDLREIYKNDIKYLRGIKSWVK